MNFEQFLGLTRDVTNRYIEAWGKWTPDEQFRKIAEEYGELASAKNNLEELEEGWDVIFAVLTYFHIQGYDNFAIMESMRATLKKIDQRSIKILETDLT